MLTSLVLWKLYLTWICIIQRVGVTTDHCHTNITDSSWRGVIRELVYIMPFSENHTRRTRNDVASLTTSRTLSKIDFSITQQQHSEHSLHKWNNPPTHTLKHSGIFFCLLQPSIFSIFIMFFFIMTFYLLHVFLYGLMSFMYIWTALPLCPRQISYIEDK